MKKRNAVVAEATKAYTEALNEFTACRDHESAMEWCETLTHWELKLSDLVLPMAQDRKA